ncbi:MAG: hypothetical protein GY703_03165 [Gammaproteobacteria bacterium]|nr:hypothetical protein [Gammaproteobacteria bacterium]
MLSAKEQDFVERRRRLIRLWPWVAVFLLVLLGLLTAWLMLKNPMLTNPLEVADRLAANSIDRVTLETMALLLPVVMLLCLSMVAVIILYGFAMFGNEKRYLAIVDRINQEKVVREL